MNIKHMIADLEGLTSVNHDARQSWQKLFAPKPKHPNLVNPYEKGEQRQVPWNQNNYSFEAQLDIHPIALLNYGYIGQDVNLYPIARHVSQYVKPSAKPNTKVIVDQGELFDCHIQCRCGHWIGYTITTKTKVFKVRKKTGEIVTLVVSAHDVAVIDAKRRMKEVCSICNGAKRPSAYAMHMATCHACQWYESAINGTKQIS